MTVERCEWAQSPLMNEYHDAEWGVPSFDDRHLFEHLVLEGAQAGLNWELVLKKREGYRHAFAGYDLPRVAAFGDDKVEDLMQDAGIVRNRLKIKSVIANARAALAVQKEYGGLAAYMWALAGGTQRQNAWRAMSELPARTAESEHMSKEMVRRGFKFFGPVGAYAFMQAVGMVNDHVVTCPRYGPVRALGTDIQRPLPRSLGSSASAHKNTGRRNGDTRIQPQAYR